MTGPLITTLDIETFPALADIWKMWDNNTSLSQLRKVSTVAGVGYKHYGQTPVHFASDFHSASHEEMILEIWTVLDSTDVLVTYNGKSFDVKHLNREFALARLGPPSPYKHVDLYQTAKQVFKFQSNKLEHVGQQLVGVGKVKHEGHELWVKCMAGDPKAWALFKRYCQQDVRLTEQVYTEILGWIPNHPHMGLWHEGIVCVNCGGTNLIKQGTRKSRTAFQAYQQYLCKDCGRWNRGNVITDRVGPTRVDK